MSAYETDVTGKNVTGKTETTTGSQTRGSISTREEHAAATVEEQARIAAREMQRAGRDALEGVRLVTNNFTHAFEQSLHERPAATVGMVAAIGFILGAMWKR